MYGTTNVQDILNRAHGETSMGIFDKLLGRGQEKSEEKLYPTTEAHFRRASDIEKQSLKKHHLSGPKEFRWVKLRR